MVGMLRRQSVDTSGHTNWAKAWSHVSVMYDVIPHQEPSLCRNSFMVFTC